MSLSLLLGGLSLLIWLYLLGGRGGFWYGFAEPVPAALAAYPEVVAVVPARDEAEQIGASLPTLLRQDYPGTFRVVLVDDHSGDATRANAVEAARAAGAAERLAIVPAPPLPPGWSGKVWAMSTGLDHARLVAPAARYVLFTDADIRHAPDSLRRLVATAEHEALDLASLMVRLRCESLAERALVPAFVFFFRMLYPFAWVKARERSTAAAAGGCMLARRSALERIGGLGAIRDQLIDDCALARALKAGGPIRLDVAEATASARAYPDFAAMWHLIARTAFTELRYSALRLVAAILLMTLVFLLPPYLTFVAHGLPAFIGLAAWLAMAVAYVPCLRYYGLSMGWAPCLPLIALFYEGATVHSAVRHWLGRGGEWKGRFRGKA
ncbi:MAG TPA: glycosyltransferase [Candidatus Sulfotelmatobacter sp.]|nr:glycosyltransferase [Candidatus Sulfotelmatobacter sp.]